MLVRSCWKPQSLDECYALIQAHPWALLVTNGPEGPRATNLPLLLDRSKGRHGELIGHISRANSHLRELEQAREASLAVFQGPSAYVTPRWYPNRDMPGTYYYTTVHCYGRPRFQDDDELETALEMLNERMEGARRDGWKLTEIPHSEITRRLPGIMGFVLEIERIEAKFKLGQDEPLKDVMAVAKRLAESDHPDERQLAEVVRHGNLCREDNATGPAAGQQNEDGAT